jgi:hypothetical protein
MEVKCHSGQHQRFGGKVAMGKVSLGTLDVPYHFFHHQCSLFTFIYFPTEVCGPDTDRVAEYTTKQICISAHCMLCDIYSGHMFINLLCFVSMHCSLTGFIPSLYSTISSLQKRMPGHPYRLQSL